ncbi:hypothetical protein [Chromobacterium phragmitis]|uniref:hypothetical protein n=1 Tax=Chromobacterium phragmitis TaxID=2202141 RepID=UPI0011AE6C59|nr:hypothetical protein [Chromobacterium phragmitis]
MGAAVWQLVDAPAQIFHGDAGVGRRCDDRRVRQRGDGAIARLEMAGEKLVEGFPAAVGSEMFAHIAGGRVEERLRRLSCQRFRRIQEFAHGLRVLQQPG